MCTFSPEVNIDDDQLSKLLASNGGVAPGTQTDPAANPTPAPSSTPELETSGNDTGLLRGTRPGAKTGIPGGENQGGVPGVTAPADDPGTGTTTPPAGGGGTGGTTPGAYNATGPWDPQAFLTARPDVMAEYNRLIATADPNSPWFTEHGLAGGPSGFATWYAGANGINTSASGAPGSGTGADGAKTTGDDLTTSLTNGFNDAINNLAKQNQAQIDQITQLNTNLTGQLGDQQKQFAQSQQQLLDGMQKSAAEQSKQFASALKDLAGANASIGQQQKKPNYGRALARNKELNSTGLSSTMLTGPGGVTPSAGQLGMTSLLGA